jgi:vacuolar-type H+-ATPase subunit E/Vma4
MITLDTTRVRDALAPLRAELLNRAAADAEATLAQANAEARAVLEAAEREAHGILDDARAAGAADTATAQATERARTRRAHQSALLAAQRNAYEQVGRRATDAIRALREEPGYPALRTRLAARAAEILGADAVVTEDPAGGIVAQAAGRRLDLSLTAFAARALERVEGGLDGLWS